MNSIETVLDKATYFSLYLHSLVRKTYIDEQLGGLNHEQERKKLICRLQESSLLNKDLGKKSFTLVETSVV
jgi:hypothetical protein